MHDGRLSIETFIGPNNHFRFFVLFFVITKAVSVFQICLNRREKKQPDCRYLMCFVRESLLFCHLNVNGNALVLLHWRCRTKQETQSHL